MRMETMKLPIEVGVKGHVKLTLTDTRDESKQVYENPNLLLDDYLNRFFTNSPHPVFLHENTVHGCHLGTNGETPQPSNTGLRGSTLASSISSELTAQPQNIITNPRFALNNSGLGLDLTPDGQYAITGEHTSSARVTVLKRTEQGTWGQFASIYEGAQLRSVTISPNAKMIAYSRSSAPAMQFRRLNEDTGLYDLESLPSQFTSTSFMRLKFSSCGKYLLGIQGSLVRLWQVDVETPVLLSTSPFDSSISDVWAETDGFDYIATRAWGASEGYLGVYKRSGESFQLLTNFPEFPSYPSHICFSGNGNRLFVYASNHTVHAWDKVGDSFNYLGEIFAVGSSPSTRSITSDLNGKYIAFGWTSASPDTTGFWIVQTNLDNENPAIRLSGHGWQYSSERLMFSKDSSYLAAIGGSNTPSLRFQSFNFSRKPAGSLSYGRKWTFPAGVGTGEVAEVALRSGTHSTWNNVWVARQAIQPAINKTEFHQLEVEWVLTASPGQNYWSGTIPNGGRDGSPVNWTYEMSDLDFYNLFAGTFFTQTFGGTSTHGAARIGENNAPGFSEPFMDNYVKDPFFTLSRTGARTMEPYTNGSLERESRLFMETDEANGKTGEFNIFIGRFTFDPPLDKVDTHRLYLDMKFTLVRG